MIRSAKNGFTRAASAGIISMFLFGAQIALAQQFDVGGGAYIETVYDDNAFRLPSRADARYEIQNRVSVNVESEYSGIQNYFSADYRLGAEEYTEGSLENDTNVSGSALYRLGNERTYYDLEISQQRIRVLTQPDSEFLSENTRNQTTTTVRPSLKTRDDKPNQFMLSGVFSSVSYSDSTLSPAEQAGGQFRWLRRTPRVNDYGVIYTYSETEFEDDSRLDYESDRVSAFLNGETRSLTYAFTVGHQTILNLSRNQEFNGITYSVDVSYNGGGNTIDYSESVVLSDTSFSDFVSDGDTGISIGGEGETQDNVEQFTRELSWNSTNLCGSCTAGASLTSQKIFYLSIPINNYESNGLAISFGYDLSRKTSLGLSASYRETGFEFDALRDSTFKVANFSVERALTKTVSLNGFIQRFTRDSEIEGYSSNRIGLRVIFELD